MSDEIETRVAILERDVTQMSSFFDRLDSTMEKLTDISSSIKELLAVHEMKINQHSEISQDLYNTIENRRLASEVQHQAIQTKIVETEKELKKEIDDSQKLVLAEMKELRKDLQAYHNLAMKTKSDLGIIKYGLWGVSVVIIFILVKLGIIPNFVLP